jgi:hypothetical protein
MAYTIESSRFDFNDRTEYATKKEAMTVIREYVKEEVRPCYKRVWRTYDGQTDHVGFTGGDGYAWVYWDAYKPARLWVEEIEADTLS